MNENEDEIKASTNNDSRNRYKIEFDYSRWRKRKMKLLFDEPIKISMRSFDSRKILTFFTENSSEFTVIINYKHERCVYGIN